MNGVVGAESSRVNTLKLALLLGLTTLVIAAVMWWIWFRPLPTIYVAVVQPQIQGQLPDDLGETLRMQLAANMPLLRGIYPLRAAEVDAAGADPDAIRRAVGADEVITTSVTAGGETCRIEITRITRYGKKKTLSLDVAPPITTLAVSQSAAQQLFELYPERSTLLRSRIPDYEAYTELWLRARAGKDLPQVLEDLSALTSQSNCPVEAFALEISTSRYLFDTTRDEKYLDHGRQVLEKAPEYPTIKLAGIELVISAGDTVRAQELIDDVPSAHPDRWWYQRWILEAKSEWSQATNVVYEAMSVRESWRHHFGLGRLARKAGKIEVAREHFNTALELVPNNTVVIDDLAYLELTSGSIERARELYIMLIQPEEYRPWHIINLGIIDLLSGNYQKAAETFENTISLDFESATVLINLADSYYLMGDERADNTYARVIAETEGTQEPGALAYRAQALAQTGRTDDAMACIGHALDKGKSPYVRYTAAITFAIIGDDQRAQELTAEASQTLSDHWFNLPWFDPYREEIQ